YVEARRDYINKGSAHHQVLIVPSEHTNVARIGRTTVYTIRSPRIDRNSGYRLMIDMQAVREIIRSERPDLIECADPYQLAWTMLNEAHVSRIPAVAFYHSHFIDTYTAPLRRSLPFLTPIIQSLGRLYLTELYNRYRRTLVPNAGLASVLTRWGI